MVKTLDIDFIMKKHNMEMHITEQLEPKLYFLNVLPDATTDTGEFSTVITRQTADQDIQDGVLGEPLNTAEVSELTEVEVTPINAVIGTTNQLGYQFTFSRKFKKRADAGANLQIALSKIIAGMAQKINDIILTAMTQVQGVTVPGAVTLSDWDVNPDPRADSIQLRKVFRDNNRAFKLDTMLLDGDRFVTLEEYYMSMDWAFDSDLIDVDGTKYMNIGTSLENANDEWIGLDSRIPPGIVQKYIDPDYSLIRQAELQGRQDLPNSMIQVAQYKEDKFPFNEGYAIWCDIGYSNKEPDGIIRGSF